MRKFDKKNKQCQSIRNIEQPYLQCLLTAKSGSDHKYCAIHLSQTKIVDYIPMYNEHDLDDDFRQIDMVNNDIIKKVDIDQKIVMDKSSTLTQVNVKSNPNIKLNTIDTLHEQKESTVNQNYKETEDDLEIKLLILINNEYGDKIATLVGPVFNDVTLSEDDIDPVTFDPIWTIENGIRVPASINKYYLFSYLDCQNKVRCLTIFTVYNMILDNNPIHPKTGEQIPYDDIVRAKELINFYQEKIQLFSNDDTSSPEYKLKNKIINLFKKFHNHNIYFEDSWILNLDKITDLQKIISETKKLVFSNLRSINPILSKTDLFDKYATNKFKCNNYDDLFEIKSYIVDEWAKLINLADNNENQLPVWILAAGLSTVVPDIKQKYPSIDYMMS